LSIGVLSAYDIYRLIVCWSNNSARKDTTSDLKWHFHLDKRVYYSSVDELYIEYTREKKSAKERMKKKKKKTKKKRK